MKCPNCKTKNGYYRMNTEDWVCRKCSTITKKSDMKLDIIEKIKNEVDSG